MAEIAIIGSDIQEVIGSAIALRVLSQVFVNAAAHPPPPPPPFLLRLLSLAIPAYRQRALRSSATVKADMPPKFTGQIESV